ncbi:hypothetical protein ACN42_g10672 [Penicillium freii]|uniref:Uncharacterized protein n=1 Tax=Penicillium freii TaxID=48697 RepID=A0A117NKR2_PENFR|nr:hypothetical protein ACN42_g10672 [Penicillium freii]
MVASFDRHPSASSYAQRRNHRHHHGYPMLSVKNKKLKVSSALYVESMRIKSKRQMRDLRGNRRIVGKRSKRDDQSAVMLSCHRRRVALGYTPEVVCR